MHNNHGGWITVFILVFFHGLSAQELSPLQRRVVNTSYDRVYDVRQWTFYAGAPVRSTPLIKNGTIYFGTAKGDFFAIDQKTARVKWKYQTAFAIHSSASGSRGKIYFSDNKQSVYALDESDGRLVWRFDMAQKREYPWRFDYYYSSPTLILGDLIIGGDDGFLYRLNQETGKLVWKFRSNGLVRSTPLVYKNTVLFGDTESTFYSLDLKSGKKIWQYKIAGDTIDDYKYGYDKRGITSSPATSGNRVVFGSRDANLYCLNAENGELFWIVSHEPSWIISTVAIKDSFVVTGTSDGRFVQALNLTTGREIWKHPTTLAVWASPLINNDKIYTGGFDGQLLCLDLKTGDRLSQFCTNGIIFSSPVINDSILYVGSDDGNLYALKGRKPGRSNPALRRFVYYDNSLPVYFRGGSDIRIKNYLFNNGFNIIKADTLNYLFSQVKDAKNTVIVADGFYFPKSVWENNENSILRRYLDAGGRLILPANNPLFYEMDEKSNEINLAITRADSVFGFHYGFNDTRSFGGLFPGFPTAVGRDYGLPDFWVSNFGLDERDVDLVLGKNENGQVSAFVKKYTNGGCLIQCWMNESLPVNLDAIIKLSEASF